MVPLDSLPETCDNSPARGLFICRAAVEWEQLEMRICTAEMESAQPEMYIYTGAMERVRQELNIFTADVIGTPKRSFE